MGGVVKICKSGRFASTKRALAISGLGSNPPAQKKMSFRVDETQYFPGSTIRSSLPRVRREASHKPGWRFSLGFWGVYVIDGFRMYRNHCVLLCFVTVLDTTWKPFRETFGYLFSLHFGRTLLLTARACSRPHDFKSGCFAWEGLSRFAKVVVLRRRNERWRFQAWAQIRRPKKKRRFA